MSRAGKLVNTQLTEITVNNTGDAPLPIEEQNPLTEIKVNNDTESPLPINLSTLLAGEDQENNRLMTMPVYQYHHNAESQSEYDIKATAGVLHAVTINTVGGAASTITILDGAETVAIIDGTVPGTYYYDVACDTDISCIVVDISDTIDYTVIYM